MKELLELAVAVAREAGALQRDRLHGPRAIETKSTSIDLVTDVDRACETLILDRIRSSRPEDSVLSEESGVHARAGEFCWVIDPVDGTTNYAHGFPHFGVSIGIERAREAIAGVVYDPMKDELFSTLRGSGAWLNGMPIQVSGITQLERALLGTGFAYDVHQARIDNIDYFTRFIKRAQGVRRAGSAALDLAYVACGRFDGFWELNLHPWDVAAGFLLVEEAGGRVSNLQGGPPKPVACVASNGHLHAAMLELLDAPGPAR